MLETSMIDEDIDLVNLINEGIDSVAEDAKEHGVMDLREQLSTTVKKAKQMVEEHIERVNTGNDILSKVNFNNNINLN
jgi:SET domain-containing protein